MTKKLICGLLTTVLCLTAFIFPVTALTNPYVHIPAGKLPKEFVVDGNLDLWYLNVDDPLATGDINYYQYHALPSIKKTDGVTYHPNPVTYANAWTAWDEQYVYLYVKVWDDALVDYDPTLHSDSSIVDSLDIWFDPNPDSQPSNNGWLDESYDVERALQDDVSFRLIAYDGERTNYFDLAKPGYDALTFGQWVNDPQNVCTFTFQDEPLPIYESGVTVSSGYGVEARFPRSGDSSKGYAFRLAANNYHQEESQRYALASGDGWWLPNYPAWQVDYVEENPFFHQSKELLATKGVMYTDSQINLNGPAVQAMKHIAALGTVTPADKEKVYAVRAEYQALTALEQGYVQYKNYGVVLEDALKIVNGDVTYPERPDEEIAEGVIEWFRELPDPADITLEDELLVLQVREAFEGLTNYQKALIPSEYIEKLEACEAKLMQLKAEAEPPASSSSFYGDVDANGDVTAADALEVLKSVVGKITLTDAQLVAADTDGNDTVDAADALNILKKVVIKIDKFPVEV